MRGAHPASGRSGAPRAARKAPSAEGWRAPPARSPAPACPPPCRRAAARPAHSIGGARRRGTWLPTANAASARVCAARIQRPGDPARREPPARRRRRRAGAPRPPARRRRPARRLADGRRRGRPTPSAGPAAGGHGCRRRMRRAPGYARRASSARAIRRAESRPQGAGGGGLARPARPLAGAGLPAAMPTGGGEAGPLHRRGPPQGDMAADGECGERPGMRGAHPAPGRSGAPRAARKAPAAEGWRAPPARSPALACPPPCRRAVARPAYSIGRACCRGTLLPPAPVPLPNWPKALLPQHHS